MNASVRDSNATVILQPGKLWSLWDLMMNYGVFGLCHLIKTLAESERDLMLRVQMADDAKSLRYVKDLLPYLDPQVQKVDEVNAIDRQHIDGLLKFATQQATTLEMQPVHDRIDLFTRKLRYQMSLHDFIAEVRALREAFESGLHYKYFYLYPTEKAKILLQHTVNWQPALAAFESAKEDVEAAVDCYALNRNTACVFHLMRVLEHGLKELAAAVNVTFDVQQWHNLIDEIENQIEWFGEKFPRGIKKNDWLKFYSEAARHFFFLKEAWRNHVSHNRADYDATSAKGAMEHVRDFMNQLSSRLSE